MQVGDARQLQEQDIALESVDCIITSPPYWRLKRYAEGDEREIGFGHTRSEYLEAVGEVLEQCLDVTKPTGVLWLVVDTLRENSRRPGPGELVPLPFELAEVARSKGWRFQDVVIWEKNKTLPYSGTGKLRNLIEYVLFFTKSQEFKHRPYRCAERHLPNAEWLAGWPERYHPLGRRPANIWQIDIDTQGMWDHSQRLHFCPFPQELVARCIDLTTDKGDVVLDPFAGIGTVPAQAIAMGRDGRGIELNPDFVEVFEQRVLSEFQASWEAQAEHRRLSRADQLEEALTIFKIRLLKAGKELSRAIDRLAQGTSRSHPADAVESVVAVEPPDLAGYVDIDEGWIGRPPARLVVLASLSDEQKSQLASELAELLGKPPFTTFGLEITLELESPDVLLDPPDELSTILEFGQSRNGAFTSPLDPRLFPEKPRLLTTVELTTMLYADRHTPLEEVRRTAERKLLQREIASGADLAEIAMRVGLPQADLQKKLVEYELVDQPRSFAIALPNQLAVAADPERV